MQLTTTPRRRRDTDGARGAGGAHGAGDAGFTLIELLVAIVILGVITVPLANALIGTLLNTDRTSDRLALSHDSQISAAYFAQDVASVGMRDYAAAPGAGGSLPFKPSIQLAAAYDAGGKTCGDPTTPVAAVRFLSDFWDNSVTPPTMGTAVVAYYLTTTGTVRELHRLRCAGSATPVSDVVVAHYVEPAGPNVNCAGPCDTADVPQQVTMSFSVTKPSVGLYPITLNGQRRQT